MQAILISDGIYSYVMFNYDHELWSLKLDDNIPSSAGYSLPDKTGFISGTSNNMSMLNSESNVHPGEYEYFYTCIQLVYKNNKTDHGKIIYYNYTYYHKYY
jgi:hypothetical protein